MTKIVNELEMQEGRVVTHKLKAMLKAKKKKQ